MGINTMECYSRYHKPIQRLLVWGMVTEAHSTMGSTQTINMLNYTANIVQSFLSLSSQDMILATVCHV